MRLRALLHFANGRIPSDRYQIVLGCCALFRIEVLNLFTLFLPKSCLTVLSVLLLSACALNSSRQPEVVTYSSDPNPIVDEAPKDLDVPVSDYSGPD